MERTLFQSFKFYVFLYIFTDFLRYIKYWGISSPKVYKVYKILNSKFSPSNIFSLIELSCLCIVNLYLVWLRNSLSRQRCDFYQFLVPLSARSKIIRVVLVVQEVLVGQELGCSSLGTVVQVVLEDLEVLSDRLFQVVQEFQGNHRLLCRLLSECYLFFQIMCLTYYLQDWTLLLKIEITVETNVRNKFGW